jgi:hypothetical protein
MGVFIPIVCSGGFADGVLLLVKEEVTYQEMIWKKWKLNQEKVRPRS